MQRIVQYSGGLGSWATANRVIESHGKEGVVLLFADTNMEDEDLYRFLRETSERFDIEITRIGNDGLTPWDVFKKSRFLGNSRIDPCSRQLKRIPLRKWIESNCDPKDTVIYLGIDWTEAHRLDRARHYWDEWRIEAPMIEPPYLSRRDIKKQLEAIGIAPPRLYSFGFSHNNCGGFCCKAGQGHFAILLRTMPERYRMHEEREEEFRRRFGDVSMLKEYRNGEMRQLTLRQLRERIEANGQIDLFDIGGCGCAL